MATSKALAKSRADIMHIVGAQRQQISLALPPGMDMDRLIRMLRTSLSSNSALAKCEPMSVLGAVIECAQLGLEPGITGHLVPYAGKATLIADYRGLIALAVRSGHVTNIQPFVARVGEEFEVRGGTNPGIHHIPQMGATGEVVAAYAVATMRNGTTQFEVVDKLHLDMVRDAVLSKIKNAAAKKMSPWYAEPNMTEMQKKTAIRRLCKYLPFSTVDSELQRAIMLDEAQERGVQDLSFVSEEKAEEQVGAKLLAAGANGGSESETPAIEDQSAEEWGEEYDKAGEAK